MREGEGRDRRGERDRERERERERERKRDPEREKGVNTQSNQSRGIYPKNRELCVCVCVCVRARVCVACVHYTSAHILCGNKRAKEGQTNQAHNVKREHIGNRSSNRTAIHRQGKSIMTQMPIPEGWP